MNRQISLNQCVIIFLILLLSLWFPENAQSYRKSEKILFEEKFQSDLPDKKIWKITRQNDFQQSIIDILNQRLRLGASTIGTKNNTVKFHGIRTLKPVLDFSKGIELCFEIDWNHQNNGCYMSAGVYLCPEANDENPRDEKEWLRFEYIGVPPGKNGRAEIWRKIGGRESRIYNEGWPKKQKTGRRIALQRVSFLIDSKSLKVIENDKLLFEIPEHQLKFRKAYIYLQMSSHSNYPFREIFFDNIRIKNINSRSKTLIKK